MRRTPVVAVLMAAFLAAPLMCVCAAPVLATALAPSRQSPDPHACCHPQDSQGATHREAPGCAHCTHAQLTAPEAAKLASPPASSVSAFLVATVTPRLTAPVLRADPPRTRHGHAPPAILTRVGVLQL